MQDAAKITPKQTAAIAALMTGATIEAAASAVGVNAATVHRWLRDPAFVEELAAARRLTIGAALDTLTAGARAAAAEIAALVNDKSVAPLVRLRAAEALLDRLTRWVELEDLQRRIEALEGRLASNT